MPSDETRRLLRTFGVAVTAYEDAVANNASVDQVLDLEAEARARLQDVAGLLDRLRAAAPAFRPEVQK
jgi:hypothetical protein